MIKIKTIKIAVFICLLSFGSIFQKLQAQEAFASLDTNQILIGEQLKLNVHLTMPEGFLFSWPQWGDTLTSAVEILKKGKIDSAFVDGQLKLHQQLLLTSFDTGYLAVPPIKFAYQKDGDTSLRFISTNPLLMEVLTVQVDTAQAIKDIKLPMGVPYTFREILPWVLGGIGIIAIIFALIYYLRKRKTGKGLFEAAPKPKLPPHIIALDELERLKHKKLWQAGQTKPYYTELTDIVRVYIEGRYNVAAIEMTSDEILEGISKFGINKEAITKIKDTLLLADLVKFAKAQPLPLENDSCLNNCVDFIQETKATKAEAIQENMNSEPIQKMN